MIRGYVFPRNKRISLPMNFGYVTFKEVYRPRSLLEYRSKFKARGCNRSRDRRRNSISMLWQARSLATFGNTGPASTWHRPNKPAYTPLSLSLSLSENVLGRKASWTVTAGFRHSSLLHTEDPLRFRTDPFTRLRQPRRWSLDEHSYFDSC